MPCRSCFWNKEIMKNIEELKIKLKEIDKKLFEAEDELKKIQKMSEKLNDLSKKIKEIEDYYFNESWQEDNVFLKEHNEDNFYCLSEDAIWNLSVSYREEKIKLIKQLVAEL